jgi:TetR/AcrR family transcriptional repressor of bet genes
MANRTNTEHRRAQIVQGLLQAMAEHGYAKATIQLIAKQVGLAPGLLHYHFKTKAEILVELVKTLANQFGSRYAALAESAQTPEDFLFAYVNARLAKGDGENPAVVAAWVMIGSEAVRLPEVRDVYQQAIAAEFSLLKSLLTTYLESKGKSAHRVDDLGAALIALMEGAFQIASGAPNVMPVGYAASTAIKLIQRYVECEPSL